MKLGHLMRLLLFWSNLQTPDGSAATMIHGLMKTNGVKTEGRRSTLQIMPQITVSVIQGIATELQCRNESSEGSVGQVMWWQTPFGSFGERYKFSKRDPIETSEGNLRISKVTLSHTGLYSCHLVDNQGTRVIPYRVNVLIEKSHKTRTRTRTAREAETSTSGYSDAQFAAAVSSSVLLTFIGAFTLGAFSQPYVIKCLQRTKARMCYRTSSDQETTRADSQRLRTVFFHKNPNSEEGTIEFAPKPSTSARASSNIKRNQENRDGAHINSEVEQSINSTSNGESGEDQEGEEQKAGQASERIAGKQPKRISRVIKLYNYDEEGNRYSHIKEPEGNPTPRQRAMSLTRLQTIMNEVESLDFSSSKESSEPDEALSMTSAI